MATCLPSLTVIKLLALHCIIAFVQGVVEFRNPDPDLYADDNLHDAYMLGRAFGDSITIHIFKAP